MSASDDLKPSPSPPAASEGEPGLGRYVIGERLGRGGMGEVVRVRDERLGVDVAMKVLDERLVADALARRRFFAEATVTARLQHPGIVAVHDRGERPDGRLWYTMTEVRGRTFTSLLEEAHAEGPPDPAQLRRLLVVLRRVSEAVAFAHTRGVVHRDLKPDNLMVGPFGEVLVMDWGLARAPGDAVDPGEVVGTPEYMAPEQARGDVDRLGPAADVWALGVMLYQALAGRRPFEGGPRAALQRLRSGPTTPFEGHDLTTFDPSLMSLCRDALAWRAEDRLPDAGAFAAELGAWLEGASRRAQAEAMLTAAVALRPAHPRAAPTFRRRGAEEPGLGASGRGRRARA
jgi:serine/threonine-protein kinase